VRDVEYFIFSCDGDTWSVIEAMNVICFSKIEYRHSKYHVQCSVACVAAKLEFLTILTGAVASSICRKLRFRARLNAF